MDGENERGGKEKALGWVVNQMAVVTRTNLKQLKIWKPKSIQRHGWAQSDQPMPPIIFGFSSLGEMLDFAQAGEIRDFNFLLQF